MTKRSLTSCPRLAVTQLQLLNEKYCCMVAISLRTLTVIRSSGTEAPSYHCQCTRIVHHAEQGTYISRDCTIWTVELSRLTTLNGTAAWSSRSL